jgi:hypothetical protein
MPKLNNFPIGENMPNLAIRVTVLGEFSPNVSLITVGRFLKIAEVAQIFGPLFSIVKAMD